MIPTNKYFRLLFFSLMIPLLFSCMISCGNDSGNKKGPVLLQKLESVIQGDAPDAYNPVNALLVLPVHPAPGENFRILATGGSNIRHAKIIISGSLGNLVSRNHKYGKELPCWRIDDFDGSPAGNYKAFLIIDNREAAQLEFTVSKREVTASKGSVWKTSRGWNPAAETIYSAWINALFQDCDEQTSWPALHEVTRNKERNFLYNCLSLDEDNPKSGLIMEPDCADNPFFLRAYFSWKLGLPFGFHRCEWGFLGGSAPKPILWVTNESSYGARNPVQSFNSFLNAVKNGVFSGTARTALKDENSDYYPVSLERSSLRPGTVFADPYGHTLILVSWKPQNGNRPGLLLSVDAQPDKTIAIKRFWKGNFLFNTSEVIGEPGFKTFRPIILEGGKLSLLSNEDLNASSGFAPFSMQQRKMDSKVFYQAMERLINPEPLDPEIALLDLIQALHEQLLVRVKSVDNGEAYFKAHPGTVISMPSSANGVFLAGGPWEDFSTPNRDLRLLIAMDAVVGFPDKVAESPEDYKISKLSSNEEIMNKLQSLLDKKVSALSITYTRSDGSSQKLSLAEILKRKDAFEMAYNPNDGVEIRWGAPENSSERSTCRRHAPPYQQKTMQSVRKWFHNRQHPPT
jgi:hypothetical protein